MTLTHRVVACTVTLALLVVGGGAPVEAAEKRLASDSFTVVAVVDTGINPYHVDFRRPGLRVHPARYVQGFPASAQPLRLTLGKGDVADLVNKDRKVWDDVKSGRLYWVPGTNLIGVIQPGESSVSPPILDQAGHGTGVASLAGGRQHGPKTDRILLVAVKGFSDGLEWAARQPWIDVITNSWSELIPVVDQTAEASREAVASGKIVCFASGNLAAPLWALEGQGPSWHVNVGAASAETRGEHYYTGYPNDVLGLTGVPAAAADSTHDERPFGGTSGATPAVCGLIAKALAELRSRVGYSVEGPRRGLLATSRSRPKGALKDGKLGRVELEDAVQATAVPAESSFEPDKDPSAIPAVPNAEFLRGGYGIVDEKTSGNALAVLLGARVRPDRELEDRWIEVTDAARDAVWGPPPR